MKKVLSVLLCFAMAATLFSVVSAAASAGSVSMKLGDVKTTAGHFVDVPLTVTQNDGILTYLIEIHFDTSKLEFVSARQVDDGFDVVINTQKLDKGIVRVVGSSATVFDVTSIGVFDIFTFKAKAGVEGAVAITANLPDADSNLNQNCRNVDLTVEDGSVEIHPVGDVNGDWNVNAKDTLLLEKELTRIVTEGIDFALADVNGDGGVNAKDWLQVRRIVAEMPLDPVHSGFGGSTSMALGCVDATAGSIVEVPLNLNATDGIIACLFEVSFDSEKLHFVKALGSDDFNCLCNSQKADDGTLTLFLGAKQIADVTKIGTIVTLTFEAAGEVGEVVDLTATLLDAESNINVLGDNVYLKLADGSVRIAEEVTDPSTTEATGTEATGTEATATETTATEATATETTATETTATETTATETSATLSSIIGNVNGDGDINMKDVLVLRKFVASITVEIDLVAADVNGDGAVNMKDVLMMRKFVAGIITEFVTVPKL